MEQQQEQTGRSAGARGNHSKPTPINSIPFPFFYGGLRGRRPSKERGITGPGEETRGSMKIGITDAGKNGTQEITVRVERLRTPDIRTGRRIGNTIQAVTVHLGRCLGDRPKQASVPIINRSKSDSDKTRLAISGIRNSEDKQTPIMKEKAKITTQGNRRIRIGFPTIQTNRGIGTGGGQDHRFHKPTVGPHKKGIGIATGPPIPSWNPRAIHETSPQRNHRISLKWIKINRNFGKKGGHRKNLPMIAHSIRISIKP